MPTWEEKQQTVPRKNAAMITGKFTKRIIFPLLPITGCIFNGWMAWQRDNNIIPQSSLQMYHRYVLLLLLLCVYIFSRGENSFAPTNPRNARLDWELRFFATIVPGNVKNLVRPCGGRTPIFRFENSNFTGNCRRGRERASKMKSCYSRSTGTGTMQCAHWTADPGGQIKYNLKSHNLHTSAILVAYINIEARAFRCTVFLCMASAGVSGRTNDIEPGRMMMNILA